MLSKVSSAKLREDNRNIMNLKFMLHKRLYGFRADGLLSCLTREQSVGVMVHSSEEIRQRYYYAFFTIPILKRDNAKKQTPYWTYSGKTYK